MSSLPLISGAESLARSFHLLIDDVLLGTGGNTDPLSEELSKLLRFAAGASDGNTSHEGVLLESLLRNEDGRPRTGLIQLADAVESGNLEQTHQAQLRDIAESLSKQSVALFQRSSRW